jgi:hypothetical protein
VSRHHGATCKTTPCDTSSARHDITCGIPCTDSRQRSARPGSPLHRHHFLKAASARHPFDREVLGVAVDHRPVRARQRHSRLDRPLPRALAPDVDRDLMAAVNQLKDPFACIG